MLLATKVWEQRKLNEAEIVNPSSSKLPDYFFYIDLESVQSGILVKENLIKKENAPSRAQRILKKNDILFQSVRPYQKNNYIVADDKNSVASTGYIQLRSKKYNQRFIFYFLQNDNFVHNVLQRCTGTTYPAISSKDFSTIKVFLSGNKLEEKQIGILFKLLDDLITLYERKYRQLQTLKSGLLQNIFNNFNSVNTVRLNQICVLKQWKTISSQKMKKKGYPVFGANGIIGYYDKYNHEKPTICITCRGATSGNILISKPYSYITGNAMCLENLSSDFNIKFLYEYLSYRELKDVITGSAQPQITSSLLGIVKIPIVPLKKQESISSILLSLDSIKNNFQIKSSYLKKIKKILLNTMFI